MKRSNLKQLYVEYLNFWDSLDKSNETTRNKHTITCRKGCSYCCKQAVVISVPEALAMLYGIYGSEKKSGYFESWIVPKIKQQRTICLSTVTTSKTWFKDQRSCVFLKMGGECWVYQDRPAVCRALLVGSAPEKCGLPVGQVIQGYVPKQWLDLSQALSYRHAGKLGIPVGLCPLPVALHWAMVIYNRGIDEYRGMIKDTVFDNDRSSLVYWSQRFGSDEMKVEIDKLLEK